MRPLFTHEIGSLAKPPWRVKAMMGSPLLDTDIEDAKKWGDSFSDSYDCFVWL